MLAFRRRLLASAVLGSHVLVLALSTALVCAGRGHTHGGLAEPDCPMHHQASAAVAGSDHGHHGDHGHAAATGGPSGAGEPRIRCRCAADPVDAWLGEPTVLETTVVPVPFVDVSTIVPPGLPRAAGRDGTPPSPPPR